MSPVRRGPSPTRSERGSRGGEGRERYDTRYETGYRGDRDRFYNGTSREVSPDRWDLVLVSVRTDTEKNFAGSRHAVREVTEETAPELGNRVAGRLNRFFHAFFWINLISHNSIE